jgi:hypothetical protein
MRMFLFANINGGVAGFLDHQYRLTPEDKGAMHLLKLGTRRN